MRVHDWPERLATAIEVAYAVPFAWGRQDCCLFAADVLLAITGVDFAAPLRGYASEAEAKAIVDAHGGSLAALVDSLLGAERRVHPAHAWRGDPVLVELDAGPTLGVVLGATVAAAGARGLVAVPLRLATVAWAVH